MDRTAFLFPGQGSQYAGMGIKLQQYSKGKETLREASEILGMDIVRICCYCTDGELADTRVAQPAILSCSIAAFKILQEEIGFPVATAGLSVGEYSALVASEVLSFTDALKLVKERGRLMSEASALNPGGMLAILGLADSSVIESICEEAGSFGVVSPANYNCPGQVVISGQEKAIQQAAEMAQKAGARSCKTLKVSGAFHSALMLSAEPGLREFLGSVHFSIPEIPFVTNVTGDYLKDPEEIREMLALQLSHPIQWEASVHRMLDEDVNSFVEFGPGKVLSGLVRRISREVEVSCSEDML